VQLAVHGVYISKNMIADAPYYSVSGRSCSHPPLSQAMPNGSQRRQNRPSLFKFLNVAGPIGGISLLAGKDQAFFDALRRRPISARLRQCWNHMVQCYWHLRRVALADFMAQTAIAWGTLGTTREAGQAYNTLHAAAE
jgi:hypothetical protein